MKKLTLTVALLAVAGTASATAQGVYTSDEGSRKIVFWYDSKDGTVVYNFNISDHTGRPATKNGILYQSSNPQNLLQAMPIHSHKTVRIMKERIKAAA